MCPPCESAKQRFLTEIQAGDIQVKDVSEVPGHVLLDAMEALDMQDFGAVEYPILLGLTGNKVVSCETGFKEEVNS